MTRKSPLSLRNNYRRSIEPKYRRCDLPLPTKRSKYANYLDCKVDWLDIFIKLQHVKSKSATLSKLFPGIKYRTFMNRFTAWCNAGRPCTGDDIIGTQDNRGGHNAAMTADEEELCATFIKTEYIEKGKPINREDIRHLVLSWYDSLHPHKTREHAIFACGEAFITRFMKRFNLYTSHGRIIKQPQITDKTTAYAQLYLAKCARAYVQYGAHMTFCMDETFWPLMPQQPTLIRIRASNYYPTCKYNDKQKEGVTLVVTIAANGEKLPLYFVTAGKTMRCTRKMKAPLPHQCFYSKSGWMKEHTMLHYLENVIYVHTNGENCALLVDSYNAHISDAVYELAERLNIELIIVPCQMTSTLSPLDVGVNGILKKIYGKEWRHRRLFEEETTVSYASAAELAINAFQQVKPHSILSAFANSVNFPPASTCLEELNRIEEQKRVINARIPEKPPKRVPHRQHKAGTRSSSRISKQLSDPCANDAILARSLVDNFDDFSIHHSEYYNAKNP